MRRRTRPAGDCPATGAAAVIWLVGGDVARARVELMAAPAQHYGAVQAEDFLAGAPATRASFEQAGGIAAAHCACSSARRGPADSATCIASVLTARALGRACLRAGGQDGSVRDPA
jgi:carbon-monoxide dehydrogenase medium subunit